MYATSKTERAFEALSDAALDRVVGGYIGETEKNLRPGKPASVC